MSSAHLRHSSAWKNIPPLPPPFSSDSIWEMWEEETDIDAISRGNGEREGGGGGEADILGR